VRCISENQNPCTDASIGIKMPADILFLINTGNLNLDEVLELDSSPMDDIPKNFPFCRII
jgi:hypothetical protein